jgi:hypothetical protein
LKTIVWPRILSILAVVCIMAIAVPCAVLADAPTTVVVNWVGGGEVTGTATAGTASVYSFQTNGNTISGNFNTTDSNNNPYSYGVDSTNAYIDADVSGGYISYQANRTGSYAPMYGAAGQTTSSFVGVGSDGVGEMATGNANNYAGGGTGTYAKPHTSGGYNYQASGTNYLIQSYVGVLPGNIYSPVGNNAWLQSIGTGTAKINDMSNDYGGNSLTFGKGQGCYTNANAIMTGLGQFAVNAFGTNGIQSALGSYTLGGVSNLNIVATGTGINYGSGITTTGNGLGSTTLSVIANYANGATVTDYSLGVQ